MSMGLEEGVDVISEAFGDTKKKILRRLKLDGQTELDELSHELKLSKMAVHKHLAALEKRGLVESSRVANGKVGRPRASYKLTRKGGNTFPRAYGPIAACALRFIERKLGKKSVEQVLRERQADIFERYHGEVEELGFEERVKRLAKLRDDEGYMADLRRLSGSKYVLYENNCPIIQLAEDYCEACTTEIELFRNLLQAEVETTHRAAKGDRACRFVIQKKRN
jgi:predicted ArsR family transcriptional regulator